MTQEELDEYERQDKINFLAEAMAQSLRDSVRELREAGHIMSVGDITEGK